MNRRFGFLVRYWWMLALAALGVATLLTAPREARQDENENRLLSGAPVCSLASVLDGSFMSGVEDWLSDSIVGRADMIGVAQRVQDAFAHEAEDSLAADRTLEALQQETLATPTPEQADGSDGQAPGAAAETPQPAAALPAASSIRETTFWLRENDGTTRTVYTFPVENVANAAAILNRFRAALPADGRVIFAEVPVSQTGNSYQKRREDYEAWGCDMEAQLQSIVDDGVEIINASEALLPHLERGEYLYFRSDHHWTARGAYIVYRAMMERLGILPLRYEDYDYVVHQNAFGENGRGKADVLEVMKPVTPVQSYLVRALDRMEQVEFMWYDSDSYMAFLGGTRGPWRLFDTGAHTGRTALLIGDSFGNALLPYLLPHYDRVLMTDLRPSYYDAEAAGAGIRVYIEHYGVEDVYIMLCFATSINSSFFTDGTIAAHLDD